MAILRRCGGGDRTRLTGRLIRDWHQCPDRAAVKEQKENISNGARLNLCAADVIMSPAISRDPQQRCWLA
jgi:hypothetical protein